MVFTDSNLKELDLYGYTVVKQVLTKEEVEEAVVMFRNWQKTIPNNDFVVKHMNHHGIYKFHEVGHQRHAWFIRTRPTVQEAFKKIWKTDKLIVSFDGCCYMPKDLQREDECWMHCDQGPTKQGRCCVQGMVSLTDNCERTIVMYEGTHRLHEEYCLTRDLIKRQKSDFVIIDSKMREEVLDMGVRRVVEMEAGDMIVWDSRTFHENQMGPVYENPEDAEERITQYVCFFPKDHPDNTQEQQLLRLQCLLENRTTNHYPCPIGLVPKQPVFFGPEQYEIDYDQLVEPDLDDLTEEIYKLV